jgi:CRP-like cAMP-binding protein
MIMHRVTLAPDDTLYTEGEPGELAYLLLSGSIRMHRGGRSLEAAQDAVIGLSALVNRPYASTARAAEHATLLAFTRRELRGMIRSDPDRAMPIIDAIIDLVAKINHSADAVHT